MLDNNKCILVYNIPLEKLDFLADEGYKLIDVKKEMMEMTVRDILKGLRFETINSKEYNESLILFNNFFDEELRDLIRRIRENIKGGILATVTEHSIDWKLSYLLEHLIEEREWFLKQQKGRA
ncbi:DUF3783 domain-containing protein [Clostridium isatidis]|uniref:DUF3783 domain-containing protein n=1 Tax=Clostridium isatidis TaxID=182773 RepID=A0A343J8Z8_9CLOT|nr:DUF3783 domain-containing protein [Clostridium isatidis]ASW42006.1 hypothetical protein BEN51_00315 [Clostridium isatidis]NLZ34005.1 DUF3783 domain-containing protein [Clostridiales bacterium]